MKTKIRLKNTNWLASTIEKVKVKKKPTVIRSNIAMTKKCDNLTEYMQGITIFHDSSKQDYTSRRSD